MAKNTENNRKTKNGFADFLTWLILLVSDGIIVQKAIGNENFDRDACLAQGVKLLEGYSI
ncbi:MAG: hypothetical protein ACI4LI_05535 [Candidatus Fimenecus sp.]